MSLTRDQKNLIQQWVASNYSNKEIIRMAAEHNPPFVVKGANLTKNYRKPVEKKIQRIQSEQEDSALRKGLAIRENRIRELEDLYQMAKDDVRNNKDGRVRTGMANVARGCLDDIAKEMGERREKVDVNANVHMRDIVAIMNKVYGDD